MPWVVTRPGDSDSCGGVHTIRPATTSARSEQKNIGWRVMSASKSARKLKEIAAGWPTDPFRPNIQLKSFFQSLASHPNLTPQAVQAARGLLENNIQKKYPLSNRTLQPASMPKHYERLIQGYERSARGTGRPWWQIFFGIWR